MSRHRKDFFIPFLTVFADVLAIEGAFLFSYWFRFFSPFTAIVPPDLGIPPLEAYVFGSLVVIPTWLFLFNARSMYSTRRNTSFSDEFFPIVKVVFLGMLIVMAAAFFYRAFSFSRLVFGLIGISAVVFLSAGRFIMQKIEEQWYRTGHDVRDVILVGTTHAARRIADTIRNRPSLGYRLIGYFSPDPSESLEDLHLPLLGAVPEVPSYLKNHPVDLALVSLSHKDHPQLLDLIRECQGIDTEIMMIPDMIELMTSRVRIKTLAGTPFLQVKEASLSVWNRILKRSFDVSFALLVLLVISPFLLVIALLIKLSSRGPVFYLQERVGLDSIVFPVYKFRTMRKDAERDSGPVWTVKDDPRVTTVGKFLRRFSLDELPQLFNVLKGEMSIVGPRPERPFFVDQFKDVVPRYLDRHRVKAGMTGWAQVNGLRGNAPIEERTKYDVFYVENWSLIFDLKIIARTVRAVLFGKDAY